MTASHLITHHLRDVLVRDLEGLQRELNAYPNETDLWALPSGIPNSAGTLALHMCGNIRHFIGARLGETGYMRDRDAEFDRRDVPRAELVAEIDRAIADVRAALSALPVEDLENPFPDAVGGVRLQTGDFLLHLVAHFGYHLGQVDYHRRSVTGVSKPVGIMSPKGLGSAERADG